MSEAKVRALFVAAVFGMAAYCATHIELSSDVTSFMPEESRGEMAVLASRLADSRLTRTMILLVTGHDAGTAIEAAGDLADRLADDPEVAWLRTGIDADQIEHAYRTYFPNRYRFLSDRPEEEIPRLVTPEALRARARTLRRQLALPISALATRVAAEDPLGAFERIVGRLRGETPALRIERGRFVTADGRSAVIFLVTHSSAFESKPQAAFLARLERAFREVSTARGGALQLEASGANRFAVAAERSIRGDAVRIAATALLGVAFVFLVFLRSLRFLALAVFPCGVGILTAATATRALFGNLDGITVAFGASLIGVAIDYSIHVIDHHRLDPGASPHEVVARLRPSLGLGAGTTMASFAGLLLTAFPGFREIGFFSITGVGAALVTTLVILPGLLGRTTDGVEPPRLAVRVARALGNVVRRLGRRTRLLALVPVAVFAAAVVCVPRLNFVDDLSGLMAIDPGLQAEDARVRDRVARVETGRVVVALGADPEAAVARNDRVAERLAAAQREGEIAGFRSLHEILWSRELQERNLAALAAIPDLAERVEAAFAAEGFRPSALAPFRASLAAAVPPLDAAQLAASPLADLAEPFLLDLGDRTAAVTYLRGAPPMATLDAAVGDLEQVHAFDSNRFLDEVYREFRITTIEQAAVGSVLVVLVLALRYRRWRPVLAALLPSLVATAMLLALFGALRVETTLLHVTSLIMVTGIGVDYGIFLVDSAGNPRGFEATMLSLLLSCLTTVFVFGTLALSSQPALRAIGTTTGAGVLLSFALAPVAFALLRRPARAASP